MAYFYLIFVIVLYVLIYINNYKNISNNYEKWIFMFLEITACLITCIIIFDMHDVFSKIPFIRNLQIDNWLDFLITMLGTLVSSFAVLFATYFQLREQNNNYRDEKRIQNKPFLLYDFSSFKIDNSIDCWIFLKGDIYSIWMSVENIGFNHLKNFKVEINDNEFNIHSYFDQNTIQSIIKKDCKQNFNLMIGYDYDNENDCNNIKTILLTVHYDDLLGNSYLQKIELLVKTTNIYYSGCCGKKMEINKVNVYDEVLIK